MQRSLLLLLLLPLSLMACQDYGVSKQQNTPGADSNDDPRDDTAVGILPFPCTEEGTMTLDVPVNERCDGSIQTGVLDAVVEWSIPTFADYPEYSEVLTVPVVGNLTDDDGDGVIGSIGDIPDIVMVGDDNTGSVHHGALHIISGDGTQNMPAIYLGMYDDYQVYPYRYASAALGDLDKDGIPEIVTVGELIGGGPPDSGSGSDSAPPVPDDSAGDSHSGGHEEVPVIFQRGMDTGGGGGGGGGQPSPCRVVAFEPDGTVKWVAVDAPLSCAGHVPAIADLEGDGNVEVIVGPVILKGADGGLKGIGASGTGRFPAYDQVGYISAISDLDGDGVQEVVTGTSLYDPDGMTICDVVGAEDGFPAIADLDSDGDGDVVVVGDGHIYVYENDCTLVTSWELEGIGNGGPPTIADFDADTMPEIGVATDTVYAVYESDGTMKWSAPVSDASSHTTGSSVFDFDGDGQAEVIYGDETTLWIYDGATGAVRLADTMHTSRTLHEYPTVADVDGDGQAEIIVPQGGGHHDVENMGLYILGSASQSWQYARPVWNQHAYNIVNVEDDLSIPEHPLSNWPDYNNFRSGDLNYVSGGATPDIIPQAVFCADQCPEGVVGVMVRLGNGGGTEMRRDIPVTIYTEVAGQRYLLSTLRTARDVGPGHATEAMGFTLDPKDIPDGVLVIVGDDNGNSGEVTECNENNNELVLTGVICN